MRQSRVASAAALAALIAACDQSPVEPRLEVAFVNVSPTVPTPRREVLQVCKDGPAGTYNFIVTGPNRVGGAFSLAAGQCIVVTVKGGPQQTVTVTEDLATLPANVVFDQITVSTIGAVANPQVNGASASADIGGGLNGSGAVFVFFNKDAPPPPPPPRGQGCTPGYWKQSQHFGSWTAPYTPGTQFSAVFENAFPGMSLLQVLGQGGGGLKALGRHTVAALLNAASSGVNYGMTTQNVIDAFNGVFPGGDYSGLKNTFQAANESGCPLGRNP